MAEFRVWLKAFCYDDKNRMKQRRNGQDGIGPLTFNARKEVLERLIRLQEQVGVQLIANSEISAIEAIWQQDKSQHLIRKADRLISLLGERG